MKIKTFERQKQCLAKVADITELRRHLTAVRTHIDAIKEHQQVPSSPEPSFSKFIPAHERFAHLLDEKPSANEPSSTPIKKIASPADLRRQVQVTENERVNPPIFAFLQILFSLICSVEKSSIESRSNYCSIVTDHSIETYCRC